MTEDFIQENEDRELFRRIKQGSEEAFREVYGKYHRILYAVALKMLKDRSAAENAVQYVFVKLWVGRQDMTVMLSLRNYLYTMTRNYILNYLRSRNTELVHSYRLAQLIPEASDPLDAQIEREDLLQMLDTVIAGLPTQKRQVMYLRKCSAQKTEVSIDEPLNTDWDGNELLLSDILGTDADAVSRPLEDDAERAMLLRAIETLGERDRQIILLRFGIGGAREATQKEVADLLGISQSYISRLEKRIIAHLRQEMLKQMQC